MKSVVAALLVVVLVGGIVFIAFAGEHFALAWREYFEPKHANVDRKVFEKTRSYNQAKVQELSKYRYEYLRAENEESKDAIASTVRHRFADYPMSEVPVELQNFYREVMNR